MAELEASAEIRQAPPGAAPAAVGRYTWRYPLPEHTPVRLGSDPAHADWVVPEDRMISRFHAVLTWDGEKLAVARRPASVEFPDPPHNHIWFRNAPVERCEVRPGERFVIGQTRFAVHGDGEVAPPSPVDGTVLQREAEYSRAELEGLPFSDPATVLRAMEQLPNYLKLVANEAGLFRQMLKVVLAGLPRADAAAIVRAAPGGPGGEVGVAVVEQNVRATAPAGEFTPSRRLAREAFRDRKSCLYVWDGDEQTMTVAAHAPGFNPWAVCTPFQDGSPYAVYVGGRARAGDADPRVLTDYQKFVEILVGLMETTRRTLRLAHQNAVLRQLLPGAVRRHLDDPARFEALIRPQEKDITILFCDLRNYSGYAEERGASLREAWKEIADTALETMSGTVTDKGGVVAGFRGDAVLGFWGWPDSHPDQAAKAAEAALRIHEKLHGPLIQKRCGLGLTHGRALAGRLGAHDLGVLDLYGPVVNLAFRLEEMTKAFGVGVVVSDELAARLGRADPGGEQWRVRTLGRVRPKGMKPVEAFELAAAGGGGSWVTGEWYHAQIGPWNEAVRRFIAGDWAAARDQLALFRGNDDPAADCLLREMEAHRWQPPATWDGSFTPRPPA